MRAVLVYCLLMFIIPSLAQSKDEKTDFNSFKTRTLKFPVPKAIENIRYGFAHIEVKDLRPDTTAIGFSSEKMFNKIKLVPKQPLPIFIADHLVRLTASAERKDSCVIVLNKFWLSDNLAFSEGPNSLEIKSGIKLKLWFFTRSGGNYLPLYQLDTTITGTAGVEYEAEKYVDSALAVCVNNIQHIDRNKIVDQGNLLSENDLASFMKDVGSTAVIRKTCKKGVYMSFEEFIADAPSITAFSVKKESKLDHTYQVNGSVETLVRNPWGYSDGEHCYIYSSNNYFRLQQVNNAFYFYGAQVFTKVRRPSVGKVIVFGGLNPAFTSRQNMVTNYRINHKPLTLDMETGEVY